MYFVVRHRVSILSVLADDQKVSWAAEFEVPFCFFLTSFRITKWVNNDGKLTTFRHWQLDILFPSCTLRVFYKTSIEIDSCPIFYVPMIIRIIVNAQCTGCNRYRILLSGIGSTIVSLVTLIFVFWALSLPNIYTSSSVLKIAGGNDGTTSFSQYEGLANLAGVNLPQSNASNFTPDYFYELARSRSFLEHILNRSDIRP